MDTRLSTDDLFDKAEEIERSGARLYRDASKKASRRKNKRMLLDLAAMEDGHLQIFQQMRQEFPDHEQEGVVLASDEDFASYTEVIFDSPGSEDSESPLVQLTGKQQVKEVLRIAIEEEKRSILFYAGLQNLVQAKTDKNKLEAIIKEEIVVTP